MGASELRSWSVREKHDQCQLCRSGRNMLNVIRSCFKELQDELDVQHKCEIVVVVVVFV